MNNRFLTLLLFVVICFNSILTQEIEWQPLTREIVLNSGDSLIRTRILIRPEKTTISSELTYYWFYKDVINKNVGGYAGELLHGSYQVFDKQKTLIAQGEFNRGLRNGDWKYWHPNGNLKRVEKWKMGKLSGKVILFDENGIPLKSEGTQEKIRNGKIRNPGGNEDEIMNDSIPSQVNQAE